jgi:uroporphyrinogen decarboxylase
MNNRQRFLNACACASVDRPPIWLMRQAGRALPEYRALKEKYSFLDLVRTPELATEVTLQPIRRFGFDAAILFSDILVVPEALGQAYRFRETGGIEMAFSVHRREDWERLDWTAVVEKLPYVDQALRLIRGQLGMETALLGFSGSPWTLANFMIEGGSASEFKRAAAWLHEDPAGFAEFLARLAEAVSSYLHMQIDAGADAVQIFDSLGYLLSEAEYGPASGRWIRGIVELLSDRVPVIVFVRGVHWRFYRGTTARVLGVDWQVSLTEVRDLLAPEVAIQGNLDPQVMLATPVEVEELARHMLERMIGRSGYIVNLGHGLPPAASLENIGCLVETVRKFAWQNSK